MRRLTFLLLAPGLSLLVNLTAYAALSWNGPTALNSTAATDGSGDIDYYPAMASDGTGNCVAVWQSTFNLNGTAGTDYDIFVARSSNNGQTWSAAALLNSDGTSDADYDAEPWIATDGSGHWVCTWTTVRSGKQNIAVSRSSNDGQTWTAPDALNSDSATTPNANGYSVVECDGDGHWVCGWYRAVTNGGDDLYYAYSVDNGATWSSLAALNSDSQTAFGNDEIVSFAADGSGHWVAVWQSNTPLGLDMDGDYDVHMARSSNDGVSWTNVAALNNDSATLASDEIRPTVATDGSGNWVAVWMSTNDLDGHVAGDYDVHAAHSSDNGATWSDPVAVNSDYANDTASEFYPFVKSDGNGTWLCIWERDPSSGDDDVYYATSTDNGASWTPLAALNTNAASDNGNDNYPRLAPDGSGGWLAVWLSTSNLNNTVGTDSDIFFSHATSGTDGTLTLTAPNGGEKWKIGTKKKITWASSGAVGANVKLELLQSGSFVQNIKASTKNDGKQKWKLPNALTPGKNYKVRITDTSDASISDTSDGSFRVKPAK